MSTEKEQKKDGRGGTRKGAGRPKGSGTKQQISLSVDKRKWQAALKTWTGKASHFVEMLVSAYVERQRRNTKQEAST